MRDVEFRAVAALRGKQVVIQWVWIGKSRNALRLASPPFRSLASCMADAADYQAGQSARRS